jgi:hypothetical protein
MLRHTRTTVASRVERVRSVVRTALMTRSPIRGTSDGPRPSIVGVDLTRPFRGTAAVRAGLLTPAVLRGPRFRRLYPDIYVPANRELTLMLRSLAAFLHVGEHGVLVRYSAAELWNASCGGKDAPAEVTLPGSERRSRPDLIVHRFRPDPDEITRRRGCLVTTAERAAYDLARQDDLTEAVVAVDTLSHKRFDPAVLFDIAARHAGDRHIRRLPRVLALADARSDSPMESRIRLAIVRYGLPLPVLQHPVGPYKLDLAYPELKLAIEYDGREHLTPERARRDLRREAYLTAAGWTVVRIPAATVFRPLATAQLVRDELRKRGRQVPNVSPAW